MIPLLSRTVGDVSVCPLCRAKWFDNRNDEEAVAVVNQVLLMLHNGELKRVGFTDLKVKVYADEMVRATQIAAYAAVRFGNPMAVTDDARAIIGGMVTAIQAMDGQYRRLDVLEEQLQVRSCGGMRANGDDRVYTDEMSSFACDVSADAVALYANTNRLFATYVAN